VRLLAVAPGGLTRDRGSGPGDPTATPPAEQGSGIFISYRRDDAAGFAGRLYDHLAERFGASMVFMDVDTIRPGQDFGVVLRDAVQQANVLLAIIGPAWLSVSGPDGQRRLDNPDDFVRLEIQAALEAGKLVIPVLVQGTRMPALADLPEPLKPLAHRHAVEITHGRWRADVEQLAASLETKVGPRRGVRHGSRIGYATAALAVGLLGIAGAAFFLRGAAIGPSAATPSGVTGLPSGSPGSASGETPTPSSQTSLPDRTPQVTASPLRAVEDYVLYTAAYVNPNVDACTDAYLEAHSWLVTADGTSAVRLLPPQDLWDRSAALSPDGGSVAFIGAEQARAANLYVTTPDGGAARTILSSDPSTGVTMPDALAVQPLSWSPGGTHIAFVAPAKDRGEDVYAVPVDGSGAAVVVRSPQDPPGDIVGNAAYMPDGRISVAYRLTGGAMRIYAVNSDGSGWGPLTGDLALAAISNMAWSRDGRWMAVEGQARAEVGRPQIYVLPGDGTDIRLLGPGRQPTWSPDGSRLAFVDEVDGGSELFVANSDASGGRKQLTHLGPDVVVCSASWARMLPPMVAVAPTPEPGASPIPVPYHIGHLAPGRYVLGLFRPRVELTLPTGWIGVRNWVDGWSLRLERGPRGELDAALVQVGLTGPCFDGESLVLGSKPSDLVTWLQAREDLGVAGAHAVNLAGRPGISVDVVPNGPGCQSQDIPERLRDRHWLFDIGQDNVNIRPGEQLHMIAIDVDGVTVTFIVDSLDDDFQAFTRAAQPVLDSIAFPQP
jgi:hypothetical protein